MPWSPLPQEGLKKLPPMADAIQLVSCPSTGVQRRLWVATYLPPKGWRHDEWRANRGGLRADDMNEVVTVTGWRLSQALTSLWGIEEELIP